MDYEYALAWYDVAYDFYSISKGSKKKVLADNTFEETASGYVTKAEDALAVLNKEEFEDIFRRGDAAKVQFNRRWYLASIFDSAAVDSLLQAEQTSQDKSLDELLEVLDTKITETEQAIAQSHHSYIWVQLYINHAKYFMQASEFYKSHNHGAKAFENAKNGVSLAYLAYELVSPSYEMYSYYESFGSADYIKEGPPTIRIEEQKLPLQLLLTFMILLLAILVVVLLLVKFIYVDKTTPKALEAQIKSIRKIQSDLRKSLKKRKIDVKTYHNLNRKYEEQVEHLLKERVKRSHAVVELDNLTARLHSYREALRELNRHYKDGLIVKEDYDKNLKFYNEAISYLNELIAADKGVVKSAPKKPAASKAEKPSTKKPKSANK